MLLGAALVACLATLGGELAPRGRAAPQGIEKIEHIVVIMQENRSFDHYFGTFPGADGIPMRRGRPRVCLPDPRARGCRRPFHDRRDVNLGGPHGSAAHRAHVNGGRMDGFLRSAQASNPDRDMDSVVGYHDAREIPNYWRYAREYVLQDRMFEPVGSWSFPAHMYMVSAWTAQCTSPTDPMSCTNTVNPPQGEGAAWTDITHLLHEHRVSWRYYVFTGREPDCMNNSEVKCRPGPQNSKTPSYWNPLPLFDTVRRNGQLGNIQPVRRFYSAARRGKLPAVTWLIPSWEVSEHPLARVSKGQAYVTSVINAIMRSPDWKHTAIFLGWDDWGGFYDHAVPPRVDANGYGIRVPGLLISPYAKRGVIDHQLLSHDAYLKFIEDVFLRGRRIDPATNGRPDRRLMVREDWPHLGDLAHEFDFTRPARRPLILRTQPRAGRGPAPVRAVLRVPRTHRDAIERPRIALRLRCRQLCSPMAWLSGGGSPDAHPRRVVGPGPARLSAAIPAAVLRDLEPGESRRLTLHVRVDAQAGRSRTLRRPVVIVG
jgi:phospholipase C